MHVTCCVLRVQIQSVLKRSPATLRHGLKLLFRLSLARSCPNFLATARVASVFEQSDNQKAFASLAVVTIRIRVAVIAKGAPAIAEHGQRPGHIHFNKKHHMWNTRNTFWEH